MNINFNDILSPITSTGRQRLQENFDMIKSHLDDLNNRLSVISPDNVDDLLQEIERALSDTEQAINTTNGLVTQIQEAINLADERGQQALADGQKALTDSQTAIANSEAAAQQVLADGQTAIANSEQAAQEVLSLGQQALELGQQAQALGEQARLKGNETEAIGQQVESLLPLIERFTDEQTNLQAQINNLVVEGDSSLESAQARVGYDGVNYDTLKSRLDSEILSVVNSLAKPNANLQRNTNTQTTFTGYENGSSTNVISSFLINNKDAPSGYLTRVTLDGTINNNTRLGVIIPESNIITYETGKRYRISFQARANRNSRLNYTFLINRGGVGNVSLDPKNVTTGFNYFEYVFTWQAANTLSQLLIGSSELNRVGDWIEIKDLIIHEGYEKIPYKPYKEDGLNLTKSTTAQAQAGTDDETYMTPLKVSQFNSQYGIGSETPIVINNGNSLNDILKGGFYGVSNTAIGTPESNSYYSLIHSSRATSSALQIASLLNNDKLYYRNKQNGVFRSWLRVLDENMKSTTAQAQAGTDDETYMTPLKVSQVNNVYKNVDTTDLNMLYNPGKFYFPSNSMPANSPVNTNSPIYVDVINRAFSDIPIQICRIGFSKDFFVRNRNGTLNTSTWSDWQKINLTKSTTNQAQSGTDDETYMTPLKVNNVTGTLNSLQTQNKQNLVSAINEVFQEVDNGKNLVASAITDKGVATPGTATFQKMADNIEAITGVSQEQLDELIDIVNEAETNDSTIRTQLVNAVNNVNQDSLQQEASFNDIINSISNLGPIKGFATGQAQSGSSRVAYNTASGIQYSEELTVENAYNFTPNIILIYRNTATVSPTVYNNLRNQTVITRDKSIAINNGVNTTFFVTNTGFVLPVDNQSEAYTWYAIEL